MPNECQEMKIEEQQGGGYAGDGSMDFDGNPAVKEKTGNWVAGILILLNQGLATLAFFGVGVNLVLFLTRVLHLNNAEAANSVSRWTGTVYIFSLIGAFLSDSYWGRYKTCAIFQAIFLLGLVLLSVTTQVFLLRPSNCGDEWSQCKSHSSFETALFYISIYMIALGNGGYQPNIATFGADQFDKEHKQESHSKISFFSYFYLALNLGSLFSNTILVYWEDEGMWAHGFSVSAASACAALVLFLGGTRRYRYFKPGGNPFCRFCQVFVATCKKWKIDVLQVEENFYTKSNDVPRTNGFKFLDKAAYMTPEYMDNLNETQNPWMFCPISQVEEVKCILRLLPIWLCTIIYSVVFTQMASLFVEQGAAMNNTISNFKIPAASMSTFDILSVAIFILLYRRALKPILGKKLSELQRMGIGLVIAVLAMVAAGIVESYRLKHACKTCNHPSSLSILWQIPQYSLIGASEVFMYVGQLEFFNAETPEGLKSFGSALCMTSISLGNYVSSLLVSIVMKISTVDNSPGWIPGNLNKGHLERFYFLLAGLTVLDLGVYVGCAAWYKRIKGEAKCGVMTEDHQVGV